MLVLNACSDELFTDGALYENGEQNSRVTSQNASDNSGLQLMSDGTWKASRRVPLTGAGRTIGNMSPGLITVLNGTINMENIINDDLNDKAILSGVVNAEALFGQIFSVKDMYRTYSGGQKAGFVYAVNKTGLLTAEVLKQFTVTLYNDGKLLKTFNLSESGGVLGLDLLNLETSKGIPQMSLAVNVPDDIKFDEIAFSVAGVDATVLNSMEFFYAFVGETSIRTTVKGSPNAYDNASIYGGLSWSNWAGQSGLVDSDEKNGPAIELVGGLLNVVGGGYRTTVNFGEKIPAGSEVGYVYTTGNLLNLGIGNTMSLQTYDPEPKSAIEKYTAGTVLGASLIGGGKAAISFLTEKSFQNLYLHVIGVNVKLGVMQFHYAYTRAKTEVDVTSEFNYPEKVETVNSYTHIYAKNPQNLKSVVIVPPAGTSAHPVYNSASQTITGMTVPGDYKVTFTYSSSGVTFTQTSIITKQAPTSGDFGCNQLITASKHKAILATDGGGALLCVICNNSKNTQNLLDGNINTCMEHFGALEVAGSDNIVTVNNIQNLNVDSDGYRAGFVLQISKELLSLNVLNFLYVDLYNNGKKLDRTVSGTIPAIDVGLLNGDQGKVRIGVTMPAGTPAFDEIRLYASGVAKLNFNTIRLYGVFYEPSKLTNCVSNGVSESCMEMLTPGNCGASINYKVTTFKNLVGLINGMYSLDNVLDDDKDSYVTMSQTEVVSAKSGIGVTFQEMPANKTIGVIVQNLGGIASVDLINQLKFKVCHQGNSVDSLKYSNDVLDLKLISHGDRSYLEFQPTVPFDEVRMSNVGLLPALKNIKIYGFYTRTDSNNDGIPDCGEEGTITDDVYPTKKSLHVCEGDEVNIPVTGGKADNKYRLRFRRYDCEQFDKKLDEFDKTVTYAGESILSLGNDLKSGVYLVDFYEAKPEVAEPYYTNLILYIHPKQTTWTGEADSDKFAHEWSHWKNWKEGAPWGCSDVVIPAGCSNYPILQENGENYCSRILFGCNSKGEIGEVVNTHYLTYDQAWVDKAFQPAQDQLLTSPLKEVYTGDVFAQASDVPSMEPVGKAAEYTKCWKMYKGEMMDANFRFAPQVYQRNFGGKISNVTTQGSEDVKPKDDNWTSAFNLVAEPYELGRAFRVRFGDDTNGTPYYIRWPKRYLAYEYYLYKDGHPVLQDRKETVVRTAWQAGRFIYEAADGTMKFPVRLTRINERPGDLYLFGNPFMTHLNVKKIFDANVGVGEVWLMRWDAPSKTPTYKRIKRTDAEAATLQISPMEGFIIKLRSPYAERNRYQYYIHLTEDMLEQKK